MQAALVDSRALPSLSPAERAVVELLTNPDPTRVTQLAAGLPPRSSGSARHSPPPSTCRGCAPRCWRCTPPTTRPAAPWTESATLTTAVRAYDRGGARLTLVHVFSHVTQNGSLVAPGALVDDWRLVRYVACLLGGDRLGA